MPTENFLNYTETDPNNVITVSATRVSWNDITKNQDAYGYKDKGVGFFSGDYKHKFIMKHAVDTCESTSKVAVWALTNDIDDLTGIGNASKSYEAIYLYRTGATYRIYLQICEAGTLYSANYTGLSINTEYYITAERDYGGGVNSKGRLTIYICTGGYHGEGGTDVSTLVVDHSANWTQSNGQWQYVFAVNTYNTNQTEKRDDYIENLDLGLGYRPLVGATLADRQGGLI